MLATALPRLGDVGRMTLASYADAHGSLLLDQRTLPVVLSIDRICRPIGPFVSMFLSESGHATVIEMQAIASEGVVRLGVTRIARTFRVTPGSTEEKALIADLSDKFGFRVDEGAEKQLAPLGISQSFEREAGGFRVSFARAALDKDAPEFAAQSECIPVTRIKID